MFRIIFSISLILVFGFPVFPQYKTALEEFGLTGKIRQINYYSIYHWSDSQNKDSSERRLTNIDIFNDQGNLTVQDEFPGNGPECFYRRTFYFYDTFNRKKETQVFQTEKGQSFCIQDPQTFLANLPVRMEVKTDLKERTIYTYNSRGKIQTESTMNEANAVVMKRKYKYNRLGKLTGYTLTQTENRVGGTTPGFVKKMEFRTKFEDGGKKATTYRYEDGQPIYREICFYDAKGRLFREEQFRLEVDDRNLIRREIPSSSSKSYFAGELEILDWLIFEKGIAAQRLYILSQNDNELMRLEYSRQTKKQNGKDIAERVSHYRFDSTHNSEEIKQLKMILKYDKSVDDPDWIPAELETRAYKFDREGNIILSTYLQQESPGKKEKSKSEYEKEIIYFR